jgi:hypothetical protein
LRTLHTSEKQFEIFTKTDSRNGQAEAWALLGGAYYWRWTDINLRKQHPARFDSIMFCDKKQFEFATASGDSISMTNSQAHLALLYSNPGQDQCFELL